MNMHIIVIEGIYHLQYFHQRKVLCIIMRTLLTMNIMVIASWHYHQQNCRHRSFGDFHPQLKIGLINERVYMVIISCR